MQTTKAPKLKTKRSKISYAKWGYIFIAPFFPVSYTHLTLPTKLEV